MNFEEDDSAFLVDELGRPITVREARTMYLAMIACLRAEFNEKISMLWRNVGESAPANLLLPEAFPSAERAASYADDSLYFIRCDDVVKIGRSRSPENRLIALQQACHKTLTLLAVVEHKGYLEFAVHDALHHIRLRGEWFQYTEEITVVIEQLKCGSFAEPEITTNDTQQENSKENPNGEFIDDARKLRSLRASMKMKKSQLAAKLSITPYQLECMERGNHPSAHIIARVESMSFATKETA